MIVAGGFYYEHCVVPKVDDGFGSGGRAAVALANSRSGIQVDWHYYCPQVDAPRIAMQLAVPHLNHCPSPSDGLISFRYFHPLAKPFFSPANPKQFKPIEAEDDVVLRFGFMEGSAKVHGTRVVYDPQSHDDPVSYGQNGSTAQSLAIVLNATEVLTYGNDSDENAAVKQIVKTDSAEIILVKDGIRGCRVYEKGGFIGSVPPYRSDRVYKIGTGDIFSAAFTYHWAVKGESPLDAADAASRCTARYCETRLPSVHLDERARELIPVTENNPGMVYLAGPFFTISDLWLVEETYWALRTLGVNVFSPYHEVGLGEPSEVVQPDLEGLRSCTAVLAIIDGCDPGTNFEIGYAVQLGIPVVVLSQNSRKSDETMILGSPNCFITDDYATAVYHAAWESCS